MFMCENGRPLCARSGRGCTSVRITKFNELLQVDAGGSDGARLLTSHGGT